MAATVRKSSTTATVALRPLKNCLVNLPLSLVSVLSSANVVAQNVVVELQFRQKAVPSGVSAGGGGSGVQKSVWVGWTGMPSRQRPENAIGPNGHGNGARHQESPIVEIDQTLASLLGMREGQTAGIYVHLDPPVAHTVNIEPLTSADWEVIELHANFLELNLLAQVRALPNPNYSATVSDEAEQLHPLALHLSPTSTANVIVKSLAPPIPGALAFAKLAADAEVIVAPKMEARASRGVREDDRSTTSTSRRRARSGGGSQRSGSSTGKDFLFLRGVDRAVCHEWFDSDDAADGNEGLSLWVHGDVLAKDAFKGNKWAAVSIVRPAGLKAQLDQHQMQQLQEQESGEAGLPTSKVVGLLRSWPDAPDEQHVALSSTLCSILGFGRMIGCITSIEPAPPPLLTAEVTSIKLYPFLPDSSSKKEGLRFGGDFEVSRQAIADRVREIYRAKNRILQGPITDGMLLPPLGKPTSHLRFLGGIIRFQRSSGKSDVKSPAWLLGSEHNMVLSGEAEIPRTLDMRTIFPTFDPGLPREPQELVGIDMTIRECMANLRFCSSVLLTGGIGSGKTSLAHFLCQRLSEEYLFNTNYFSCRKFLTEETRITTIKDTLTKLFMSASWCARLGGQSVVVLDDLDKICPVETELQVGNDNGRSRLITEILCSVVRYYCTHGSGICLLATAQSKDTLNHIIISGHIVGDIIPLKAPNKEARQKMLMKITGQKTTRPTAAQDGNRPSSSNGSNSSPDIDQCSWKGPGHHETGAPVSPSDGIMLSPSLDFLDLAGRTDGFMPGDLSLLVSRACNECLTRTISSQSPEKTALDSSLTLTKLDFTATLKNFTPTSLRNVPLTRSTTTFSSIGGLHATRSTLLETLLYPTKYAPIFANCPLRLRSGLLLYGYPGCGKTLLASAVAGECGLNFISVKGPEILNKYIGASEKSVRDLFERAQAAKPCVLFFDEFDSLAPKRGHDSTGVTDRVVNQLLTQMDGAEGLEGVYVLAATSRPDLIDPALLRPGRLDKSLLCDMPDRADRLDILRAVSKKLNLAPEVEARLTVIADRTDGFSGADLQALMYNAHLEAVHELLGDSSGKPSNGRNDKGPAGARNTPSLSSSYNQPSSAKKGKKKYDLIQFLYDPEADAQARAGAAASPVTTTLPPNILVEEKVAALELSRKRERWRRRHISPYGITTDGYANGHDHHDDGGAGKKRNRAAVKGHDADADADDGVVVLITWPNVERALAATTSSITEQERSRLAAIYHEFVVGRNGEMPSGEGARDIGGRTSLM